SWSTGDTLQTIDVYTTGTYSVTVSLGTCTASDEIKITEHILNISVGTQDTICQGSSASLFATGGTAFQWSTGDTSANISVTPLATTTYYVTVADSMCSQTDSVIIYVNTLPIADAGSNQIICVSDSATLTATGGDTYLWSTGDTVSTIDVQPLTTTTYIVTVTDVGGCFATDSVTITVINGINISISGDVNICLGENTELTASGASNYLWSTGQVDSSVIVAPVSDSVFTVIGNIGSCYDTLSVTVFVHPLPVVYVSQDTVICSGDTVTITASGGDNYIWSNGVNNASQQVTPNTTTTFYVTVSNAFGCSDTGSVTLTVLQTPIADAGGDQTICYGTVVQLSASGGTTYLWEANTSLSDVNISNPMASPMETTTYYVTVSNGNCFDTDSTVITVQPLPQINAGQDTTIYQGEAIQLLATGNVTNFLWSPAAYLSQTDISNPVASPQTTITYTVTGIDVYGCQSSDNITITVTEKPEYELVIYNTFTPNGDGVNDTWYIENIDKYPDNLVQVYNRNGHIVYEKLGYLNEWDGKFYGNDLPAATYYYIINLNDGSELLKGNVTIVR
ncbi:MAG TPA: gliding motility-associated C-terminal domain-containing protein, partial [Bacteroidales bacterium]|nr:gliding motility-associated C-terminal domain-containing protein [Bacteroidales bacterium]